MMLQGYTKGMDNEVEATFQFRVQGFVENQDYGKSNGKSDENLAVLGVAWEVFMEALNWNRVLGFLIDIEKLKVLAGLLMRGVLRAECEEAPRP